MAGTPVVKLRLLAVLQTPGAGHLPTAGSGPRRTCPYGLGDPDKGLENR